MSLTQINDSQTQAYQWFRALCWVAGVSVVFAFVAFGNIFPTDDIISDSQFNGAVASGAAVSTAFAWLPFIAILDVMRRRP